MLGGGPQAGAEHRRVDLEHEVSHVGDIADQVDLLDVELVGDEVAVGGQGGRPRAGHGDRRQRQPALSSRALRME